MKTQNILRLCIMAMLTAISVVLMSFVQIPLIPGVPFLVYDMADAPILLGAMLLGPWSGLLILAITSFIQCLMPNGNGLVGFLMHFVASGALVLIVSWFYRKWNTWGHTIAGMVLGTLAMTAIMIPMNLWLTTAFLGAKVGQVVAMLIPAIIPFNLLKAAFNCILTAVLFRSLQPFFRKYPQLLGETAKVYARVREDRKERRRKY